MASLGLNELNAFINSFEQHLDSPHAGIVKSLDLGDAHMRQRAGLSLVQVICHLFDAKLVPDQR